MRDLACAPMVTSPSSSQRPPQVLAGLAPDSPHAPLLQMALTALQQGHAARAVAWAEQLVRQAPSLPLAHLLKAKVLRATGQPQQALLSCRKAARLAPGALPVLTELALTQRAAGQPAEAEATYREALKAAPQDPVLHHNLANLLQHRGALDEAEPHYRQALAAAPGMAEAQVELGRLLQARGREDEARQCFMAAIHARPGFAPAWEGLSASLAHGGTGQAMEDLRHAQDGLPHPPEVLMALAQAALSLDANNVLGHYTHGMALRALGRLDEARQAWQTVMTLAPEHEMSTQALYMQALCHLDQGHYAQAEPLTQALLSRARVPEEQAKAHLLGAVLHAGAGDMEAALPCYDQALALGGNELQAPARIAHCLALNYAPEADAQAQLQLARRHLGALERPAAWPAHTNQPDPSRPLRVGLLSGDFRLHSCAYFLAPLLEHLDSSRFEVHGYYTEVAQDDVTEQLRSHMAHWHPVSTLSPEALAERIRADGIDILVDLAGLTHGHRLQTLVLKPAPVQIGWLGYLGTLGLQAQDHRMTDPWVDPEGAESWAHEQPLRLARPYVCYQPLAGMPEPASLPLLDRGHITFGSFNALSKLSGACLALWARVLQAVPGSRLLIKNMALADPDLRARLLERLARHGIEPDRVDLRGWTGDTASHLNTYGEVDIALDSWPYQGVTTTCEAAWMGVPTVSLVGRTFASRQGLTLLTALGLADLAVDDEDAYVQRCLALAADTDALAALRGGLRARMAASALMDGPGFARAVEQAWRQAWQGWCERQQANTPG